MQLEAPVAEERPPEVRCGAGGDVGTHRSWNYVRYVGGYGLGFVSSVVLARWFQPADYGVCVGAFAAASFVSTLISLGLEGSALVLVPESERSGDMRRPVVNRTLFPAVGSFSNRPPVRML